MGLFKKNKALIIVDVQNDFIPGGALPVPKGNEAIPYINKLQADFDLVVATKDWHPADHCSFASAHPGRKAGERIDLERGTQLLWPDHCVQHSKGAEFVPSLETKKIAKTFEKGIDKWIDSYSGLHDNDNARATGLEDFLKLKKVEEVHIVGLATDYTVKYTALDCAIAGFKTIVHKDGCRAVNLNAGDEDRALKDMKHAGVHVQ
jgi:nicotinamidase/pyrazinamidase